MDVICARTLHANKVNRRIGVPLLVLSEGRDFGVPVWQYAASRREKVCLYGPRSLGEAMPDNERAHDDYYPDEAWACAWTGKWQTVSLGRWGQKQYALYVPRFEAHFSCLCRFADRWGGMIEIAVPTELQREAFAALSPIWSTMRPVRYLRGADLCRELRVPWAFLLGIYNYAPRVSVFLGESERMVEELRKLCSLAEDCAVIPLDEALATEQKNWEDIYRQFEEPTPEEEAAQRASFANFSEEVERRYGPSGTGRAASHS